MRIRYRAIASIALVAVLASGCKGGDTPPPPSIGHDRERAGEPDPPAPQPSKEQTTIRFTVNNSAPVVVTWNAGFGNRFTDPIEPPGTSWTEKAVVGKNAYVNATPWRKQSVGNISVYIDYGTNDELICFDTNYANLKAGADCSGRIHRGTIHK